MSRQPARLCAAILACLGDPVPGADADDPLLEAELQEQADLERLRAVNSGELVFLNEPAEAPELHTEMSLILNETSLHDGWVDMRQCQRGLDGMQLTEIVYRYAEIRALRITDSSGIDASRVEDRSVQLHGITPGAEICIAAGVKVLKALGDGRYRIVSGPYHRRFFDGYFPMRLSLEVTFPAESLGWRNINPLPQPGYAVHTSPGRVAIDTRFAGRLTLELEFAQPGYPTPQPPSPQ